jgi:S-methylmethionine-dependent homocysteine/selenocysteine methylase
MRRLLKNNDLILMEASIVESLRRNPDVSLDPVLVNAPLIYDVAARHVLAQLYQDYIDIAVAARIPFLMCTPTWRTSQTRVAASGARTRINIDAVNFLRQLREGNGAWKDNIRIGGMIGCKNDCYKPEQGLSAPDAEQFHAWQLGQLKRGGVDFLIAETLPNVQEAIGIARAMGNTGLPYIISFVISRDGQVLDGTSLVAAMAAVDAATRENPLGFMVNCAYPSFLCVQTQPPGVFERLIGYQANASSLDHCDLDGAEELHQESTSEWGDLMLGLNRDYGVKILGGCCGTGTRHLRCITRRE